MRDKMTKDEFEWHYIEERLTILQISAKTGVPRTTLERWRKEWEIPTVCHRPVKVGRRFGKLTVLDEIPGGRRGTHTKCRCLCDCGKETVTDWSSLVRGRSRSCGCGNPQDLTGRKFNRLTVLADRHGKRARILCRCDCGKEKTVLRQNVVNGSTKSCGCLSSPIIPAGTVFSRWTVLDKIRAGSVWKYLCRCSCGTERLVSGTSLVRGISESCGCLAFERKSLPIGEAMFHTTLIGYRHNAKKRKLPFALDEKAARKLFSGNCHYCGASPASVMKGNGRPTGTFTYNGIDRIDNALGYFPENCVSCCPSCNQRKRDMSTDDFLAWVRRLLEPKQEPTVRPPLTEGQIRQRLKIYRKAASVRGLPFELDDTEFGTLLKLDCSYCGAPPSNEGRLAGEIYTCGGIDRVDNAVGYVTQNCVPSCRICNWGKSDGSVSDLMRWAERVAAYQGFKKSVQPDTESGPSSG